MGTLDVTFRSFSLTANPPAGFVCIPNVAWRRREKHLPIPRLLKQVPAPLKWVPFRCAFFEFPFGTVMKQKANRNQAVQLLFWDMRSDIWVCDMCQRQLDPCSGPLSSQHETSIHRHRLLTHIHTPTSSGKKGSLFWYLISKWNPLQKWSNMGAAGGLGILETSG